MNIPSTPQPPSAVFRTDLQSLRALAVVAVLLFHFKLLGVSGGFLGVDIFFVLSGFFITAMLRRSEGGPWKNTLINFYQKRFWRIAPALFTTIIATLAIGWFVYLPQDYARLGISAIYSTAFLSNSFFAGEAGYFDTSSNFKPLLHTWSLAVEMQFYLVWPLLFLLFKPLSDRIQTALLWLLITASFIGAFVLAFTDPAVAFYAMPFRLWEFAIGALCAHPNAQSNMRKWGFNRDFLRLFALAIIIACLFYFDNSMIWPAPFAAIPIIATAVLISTGREANASTGIGWSEKILGWKPFVWLGEISYSLYLVHWPIVTISYMLWWPNPPMAIRIGLLGLSIPLAWLLYHFIEQPFRFRWSKWSMLRRWGTPTIIAVSLILAAQVVSTNNGFVKRYPEGLQNQLGGSFVMQELPAPIPCVGSCEENKSKKPTEKIFLWGDSHAGHFSEAVGQIASENMLQFFASTNGGCPPFPNLRRVNSRVAIDLKCPQKNKTALRAILSDAEISTVVLAARWAFYSTTIRFGQESSGSAFLVENNFDAVSKTKSKFLFARALKETVERLVQNGKKVIILDQVPEFKTDSKRCWLMAKLKGNDLQSCAIDAETYEARLKYFRTLARGLADNHPLVSFHNLQPVFCQNGKCYPLIENELAYSDNNHLLHGAAYHLLKETGFLEE